ncbi:predicted protein [Enterococcus gallinarum EG2]|nr:predicted protein [Enterococcus gallinarum EG2]
MGVGATPSEINRTTQKLLKHLKSNFRVFLLISWRLPLLSQSPFERTTFSLTVYN